jgi:Fe-S cluster biogenesis protein NfuA
MTSQEQQEELTFEELLERIGELMATVEQADPELRDPVMEVLDYLEAWHREGITRLATAVPPDALESAREDPVVAHLLDTYLDEDEAEGEAVADPEEIVNEALDEIRPYVHSHGGEMELVAVSNGVVTLRLMGSCYGCPSSEVTLTQGIEQALRQRWPGFRRIEVQGAAGSRQQPQQLLQIESLRSGSNG